jgi:hypothetical protein
VKKNDIFLYTFKEEKMSIHLSTSYYRNSDKATQDGWTIKDGKVTPPETHEASKRTPKFYKKFRNLEIPDYFIDYYPLEEKYQKECDYYTKVLESYKLNKDKAKADGWNVAGEGTFALPPKGHKADNWCASFIPNEEDGNSVPDYFIQFYPLV